MRHIFMLMIIVVCSPVMAETPPPNEGTYWNETVAKSKETKKPILLYFGSLGCPPCAVFSKHQKTSKKVQEALDKVLMVQFDPDVPRGKLWWDTFSVKSMPTWILVDHDLNRIYQWSGYDSKPDYFLGEMDAALGAKTSITERLAEFKTNPTYESARDFGLKFLDNSINKQALEFFEFAERLRDDTKPSMELKILHAKTRLYNDNEIPIAIEELYRHCDNILASEEFDRSDKAYAIYFTDYAATNGREQAKRASYLAKGRALLPKLDRTRENRRMHTYLTYVPIAIVDGDAHLAARQYGAMWGEDWETNPDHLLQVAWWCENRDLFEPGLIYVEKALAVGEGKSRRINLMICKAKLYERAGKVKEALALIDETIAFSGNEYYVTETKLRMEKRIKSSVVRF